MHKLLAQLAYVNTRETHVALLHHTSIGVVSGVCLKHPECVLKTVSYLLKA
jgi:hypothetical protein